MLRPSMSYDALDLAASRASNAQARARAWEQWRQRRHEENARRSALNAFDLAVCSSRAAGSHAVASSRAASSIAANSMAAKSGMTAESSMTQGSVAQDAAQLGLMAGPSSRVVQTLEAGMLGTGLGTSVSGFNRGGDTSHSWMMRRGRLGALTSSTRVDVSLCAACERLRPLVTKRVGHAGVEKQREAWGLRADAIRPADQETVSVCEACYAAVTQAQGGGGGGCGWARDSNRAWRLHVAGDDAFIGPGSLVDIDDWTWPSV